MCYNVTFMCAIPWFFQEHNSKHGYKGNIILYGVYEFLIRLRENRHNTLNTRNYRTLELSDPNLPSKLLGFTPRSLHAASARWNASGILSPSEQ